MYCPQMHALGNLDYVQPNNEQIHTVSLVSSQSNEILFPQYSKNSYKAINWAKIIHMRIIHLRNQQTNPKNEKKTAVKCTDALVISRGYSGSKYIFFFILNGTNITSDKWIVS